MVDIQDITMPPIAMTPDGKRLRERFRYAVLALDPVHAQLVDESVDRLGKDTVLGLFERNTDMKRTMVALAKLAKAWSPGKFSVRLTSVVPLGEPWA